MVTAPPPDKLFPKVTIGISIWAMILLRKFQFFQPLHRVLAELQSHQLNLSAGTITDGLKKLEPLFQPLYDLLVDRNREEGHWHGDETRWLVFEKQADKVGYCHNLWVFAGKESIVYVLDPTRAHEVPEDHFGEDAEGILSVDRYSAYKAMAQVKSGKIQLAFCWAHVRRDFLTVLTSWPALTEWAWSWVEEINLLFHLNHERLDALEAPRPTIPWLPADDSTATTTETPSTEPSAQESPAFVEADKKLREHLDRMRERRDQELSKTDLRHAQRKPLASLQNHWSGLTIFVDRPEIPMDNNKAERCHRGPVIGRKNFYGSGALWSGRLAAMLFSVFQTMQASGLDVALWLTAYLTACAKAKGKPPPEIENFLPWNMTEDQRKKMTLPRLQPPNPEKTPQGETPQPTLTA